MRFHDRREAGRLLAQRLEPYRHQRPIVLGIPRGGMPLAAVVARQLGAEVDVILVHQFGIPFQPELAFGSLDETGHAYLTCLGEELAEDSGFFEAEKSVQVRRLREMRLRYSGSRPPLSLSGRTVIVIDDALATGATAIAAVRSARARGARRVVVAVAVGPKESVELVKLEADDVECLVIPAVFHGASEFFDQFPAVTDGQIIDLLGGVPPVAPQSPQI